MLTIHILDHPPKVTLCGKPIKLGKDGGIYVYVGDGDKSNCDDCKTEAAARKFPVRTSSTS